MKTHDSVSKHWWLTNHMWGQSWKFTSEHGLFIFVLPWASPTKRQGFTNYTPRAELGSPLKMIHSLDGWYLSSMKKGHHVESRSMTFIPYLGPWTSITSITIRFSGLGWWKIYLDLWMGVLNSFRSSNFLTHILRFSRAPLGFDLRYSMVKSYFIGSIWLLKHATGWSMRRERRTTCE